MKKYGVLLQRLGRGLRRCPSGFTFRLGVFFLLFNFPFGYGGMAICASLAAAKKDPRWVTAGGACYVLSWVMLGLGTLLAGKTAKNLMFSQIKRVYRAWRRFYRNPACFQRMEKTMAENDPNPLQKR